MVSAHNKKGWTCLHWAANYCCVGPTFTYNGYTTIILAAKMNLASVAMLMLGVGCSAAVVGEVGQMLAQRGRRARDVEEKNSATSVTGHGERQHRHRWQDYAICSVIQHHFCFIVFLLQSCVGLDIINFSYSMRTVK